MKRFALLILKFCLKNRQNLSPWNWNAEMHKSFFSAQNLYCLRLWCLLFFSWRIMIIFSNSLISPFTLNCPRFIDGYMIILKRKIKCLNLKPNMLLTYCIVYLFQHVIIECRNTFSHSIKVYDPKICFLFHIRPDILLFDSINRVCTNW